eukprot:760149-Hanusia_phi.AAC.7
MQSNFCKACRASSRSLFHCKQQAFRLNVYHCSCNRKLPKWQIYSRLCNLQSAQTEMNFGTSLGVRNLHWRRPELESEAERPRGPVKPGLWPSSTVVTRKPQYLAKQVDNLTNQCQHRPC